VVENCKGNGHIGAREFYRRVSPRSSGEVSDNRGEGGLRDERRCENLELELAKSLTRKRRESRVPEQRYGEKDVNTTQFAT